MRAFVACGGLCGLASAAEPEAAPEVDDDAEAKPLKPYRWGGVVVPLIDYNSTDGLGLGLGVEVFDRKRGLDHGYRNRISFWTVWTTSGNYSSNYLQYERRSERHLFLARVAHRAWYNMIYVGAGGADVAVEQPLDRSLGNTVVGPLGQVQGTFSIPNSPVNIWVQAYGRFVGADARPGGVLHDRQAYGLGGIFYFDTSIGFSMLEVDRYPMPHKGMSLEGSARFGGSTGQGDFRPLAGMNLEAMGWWPAAGKWFVLGGRVLFDKTWGERPFWEQEWLGGQQRDELAYEQMLTGYARSRTRGDGVFAAMIELRPYFGKTRHPFVDMAFYLSAYAELAYLFVGDDPGPPMPTLGIGPEILWQGAVQFRPFLAVGWVAPEAGAERAPYPVFGISVLGPL